MASDPVTAGLGGISALQGYEQNRKAGKRADEMGRMQRAIMQRAMALFDRMMGEAESSAGQMNAENQITDMTKRVGKYESDDLASSAAAMRIAGYKPGDSENLLRLGSVHGRWKEFLGTEVNRLNRQNVFDRMSVLGMVNPSGLGLASNIAGQQQGLALGGMQDPTDFFRSLMPFMNKKDGGDDQWQAGFERSRLDEYGRQTGGGRYWGRTR